MNNSKKLIVVSAVNLTSGGTLSILEDCLSYISEYLSDKFDIIALVNDKKLFSYKNIQYIEFPKSKKSWLIRIFYEWYYFYRLSFKLKPYLWLSLHDMTPRVIAEKLAVYCHNPAPFYNLKMKEVFIDVKFTLFNLLYSFLYKININKNDCVIVQQNWIRKEFIDRYKIDTVVVAYPNILIKDTQSYQKKINKMEKHIFFFPTLPRIFKNIEIICQAASILNDEGYNNYEIWITISGSENRYARNIVNNYSNNKNIKFIGIQTRDKVYDLYEIVDNLIFPSKLETWGLPLSEFKIFKKPILVADLPYAHETVGDYDYVKYFDPDNKEQLVNIMKLAIDGKLDYDQSDIIEPSQPFANGWHDLFDILLKNK